MKKTKQAQQANTNDAQSSVAGERQEEQLKSLESRLARALADYQNLENRFGRESSSIIKFATAGLLQKLLSIRDHLEMAVAHLQDKSLAMILSQFDKVLEEEGVKEIKVDGTFDPAVMECQEQAEGEKDQVLQVTQKGYSLHDRVLRPARVIVGNGLSTHPTGPGPEGSTQSNSN